MVGEEQVREVMITTQVTPNERKDGGAAAK